MNFSLLLVPFPRNGKDSIPMFLHGCGFHLQNIICCHLKRKKDTYHWRICALSNQKDKSCRDLTWKEEVNNISQEEEPLDNATLVCTGSSCQEVKHYDIHIVYSPSYQVPVLYFRFYHSDGQPLSFSEIEKDFPVHSEKIQSESKWTFITQEEHPYLKRPWCKLHPCGTSEWMKLLFHGDTSLNKNGFVVEQYLTSWFSVTGQVIGLNIPLGMLDTVNSNYSQER